MSTISPVKDDIVAVTHDPTLVSNDITALRDNFNLEATEVAEVLESDNTVPTGPAKRKNIAKFALASALGVFAFAVPIPIDGVPSIPIGIATAWFEETVFHLNGQNVAPLVLLVITTLAAVGTIAAKTLTLAGREGRLIAAMSTSWLFLVSRVLGAAFVWMTVLGVGPYFITSDYTGGVMVELAGHIVALIIFLGLAMPLLTEFGVMEFIGALIRKAVNRLFTLPGKSSIDLIAGWFGGLVGVILAKKRHEAGAYTGRQAAIIATNFAIVPLPFIFVVAYTIGIEQYFIPWYLTSAAVAVLLAVITPRIWPLRGLTDSYADGVTPAPEQPMPDGISSVRWGIRTAAHRASKSGLSTVFVDGSKTVLDIWMDLVPLVVAWGVISLAIFEFTPVFQFLATPMGWYMSLLGIEGSAQYAPAALIGLADMYLPAVLLIDTEVALHTRLILGGLSIIQVIYLTETGATIIRSKMPLNFGKVVAVFLIRTVIALPLLTLFFNLLW